MLVVPLPDADVGQALRELPLRRATTAPACMNVRFVRRSNARICRGGITGALADRCSEVSLRVWSALLMSFLSVSLTQGLPPIR
jgi:hypothetical protein